MMVGFIKFNEGNVFFDNEDIIDLFMYQCVCWGIGYLLQEFFVFCKFSVEDNIKVVLEMIILSKDE